MVYHYPSALVLLKPECKVSSRGFVVDEDIIAFQPFQLVGAACDAFRQALVDILGINSRIEAHFLYNTVTAACKALCQVNLF